MSEAHNHHYVPQAYLRGFADGIGRQARLKVIDLEDMKTFPTNVRNVASKRDFNRLEAVEGLDIQAVATALNGRPRKTLGWKSPAECLALLLEASNIAPVATTA